MSPKHGSISTVLSILGYCRTAGHSLSAPMFWVQCVVQGHKWHVSQKPGSKPSALGFVDNSPTSWAAVAPWPGSSLWWEGGSTPYVWAQSNVKKTSIHLFRWLHMIFMNIIFYSYSLTFKAVKRENPVRKREPTFYQLFVSGILLLIKTKTQTGKYWYF